MRFRNTETTKFSPGGADGQPTIEEVGVFEDREGNALVTFTKNSAGTFSHDLPVSPDQQAAIDVLATGAGFTLPTEDPLVEGALWSDLGTVKVSAGA